MRPPKTPLDKVRVTDPCVHPICNCLEQTSRRALALWLISFKLTTLTFSLNVARQTGVPNPLLPKLAERISSFGNTTVIISKSASDTWLASNFRCVYDSYGIAPSLDPALLSHRVLPHPGLCLYAYSRSGLKTLAYSTLPVQTMARIATTEGADGIRDEEDVSSAEEQAAPSFEGDAHTRDPQRSTQDKQMQEDLLLNFTFHN
jgi:hypothetical protein